MIVIIDYGLGNIMALRNLYERLSIPVAVARSINEIDICDKLILPGVGAFDQAMVQFNASGMRGKVEELVHVKKIPILGICVGMQILATSSEEGSLPGLGWIDGTVKRFDAPSLALPHMGWNDVIARSDTGLFSGLASDARFYFLHSYYMACMKTEDILAMADYSRSFPCAVQHENVYGVQFHPEKSHRWGLQLLKNFAHL